MQARLDGSPVLDGRAIPRLQLAGCSIDPILEYLPDVKHWARLGIVWLLAPSLRPVGSCAVQRQENLAWQQNCKTGWKRTSAPFRKSPPVGSHNTTSFGILSGHPTRIWVIFFLRPTESFFISARSAPVSASWRSKGEPIPCKRPCAIRSTTLNHS